MRPTRTTRLLLGAGAVAVLGWLALRWWIQGGRELPMLPWTAPAVMGLLAIAVLVSGWQVRQWTRGRRERALDPLRAARTVVLAKASQYAGALLSGWYAAQALAVLPTVDVEPRRGLLVRGLVSLAAAVVLWVVGWLVERWCRVPVDDDDKAPPSQGATA